MSIDPTDRDSDTLLMFIPSYRVLWLNLELGARCSVSRAGAGRCVLVALTIFVKCEVAASGVSSGITTLDTRNFHGSDVFM